MWQSFNIWELRRAVKIFQNITASLVNLDPCLVRITFCYLHFLHSAFLGQNCSAEAPSDSAEHVHHKNQAANQDKPTVGADPDIFADQHFIFLPSDSSSGIKHHCMFCSFYWEEEFLSFIDFGGIYPCSVHTGDWVDPCSEVRSNL